MRIAHVELKDLPSGLKSVHDCWDSLRNHRFAPSWSEIDLVRFPANLLPTTMVVDVHDPVEDSIFRYWGSKLSEIHGCDMTSLSPYALTPAEFGQQLLEDHKEIIEKKIPMAWHYSFLAAGGYMHSHSLIRLPLSNDGKNVHHIIVVVDYSDEAKQLMKLGREKFDEVVTQPPKG
ncbi:MAG: PAS domain-containing protein [Rhodospirillales bacterium]